MKRNRDDQGKIQDLKRQVSKLELNTGNNAGPQKNGKGGRLSPNKKLIGLPQTEDKECQTVETQSDQKLKK